jgi:hypothetical protein
LTKRRCWPLEEAALVSSECRRARSRSLSARDASLPNVAQRAPLRTRYERPARPRADARFALPEKASEKARATHAVLVRSDRAAVGQWRDCVVTKGGAGWLR